VKGTTYEFRVLLGKTTNGVDSFETVGGVLTVQTLGGFLFLFYFFSF